MLSLINPIPEAIRDVEILEDFVKKYNIVPYFGCDEYTSHSFIKLISDACELSPSHEACKRDFKTYAFGNCAQIVSKSIPGFYDEDFDNTIPRDQQLQFFQWLDSLGLSLTGIIDCVNELNNSSLDSGNSYLLIRIVKIGSTQKVFMFPLHYTQCGFLAVKNGEVKKLINTEYWSEEWWKKKKPLVVSASKYGEPFIWDVKKNESVKETILHIRSSKGQSKYYGRSSILSVLYWMFVEHQLADLSVKTSRAEYTAKNILAIEEPKPERKSGTAGSANILRKKMAVLRALTTNEGGIEDAKTIAAMQYPHGGKAPIAIPLNVNRDTKHAEYQWDKASALIHSINGWDRTLTNIVTPKANLGGNIYKDLFLIKGASTIEPMQDFWSGVLTTIFSEIAVQTKYTGEVRSLKFKSAIDNLVDKLGDNKNLNQDNNLNLN